MKKLMDNLKEKDPLQEVVTKRRPSRGNEYTVHWGKLKAYLEKTMLYDPNAGMG